MDFYIRLHGRYHLNILDNHLYQHLQHFFVIIFSADFAQHLILIGFNSSKEMDVPIKHFSMKNNKLEKDVRYYNLKL